MRLTDQQERLIARYLRETDAYMADVPERSRERALKTARQDILNAIPSHEGAVPDDAQVEEALQTVGPPSRHAHTLIENMRNTPSAEDSRRWLGVCAAISEQTGISPVLVRLGAVVAGVITGPLALITYIGAYLILHFSKRTDTPPIEKWTVTKYVLGVIFGALLLRYVAWGFVVLIEYGYGLLFQEPLNLYGLWNWLANNDGALFFWTLFLLLPVAILAGLPVPPHWRNTLRKLFEAGLAVYALVLCFGVGCALAGAILQASKHVQDPTTIDFQSLFSAL